MVRSEHSLLIGVGSRRRSTSQAIDLPSDGGVNLERLFTVVFEHRDIQAMGISQSNRKF
jgi:hypothetical protein